MGGADETAPFGRRWLSGRPCRARRGPGEGGGLRRPARDACQQIAALARAYDAAFNGHDVAGVAGLFTEDAVWMPEGPAQSGRGAIEKFLAGLFKAGLSNEVINVREAHVAGDTAWAVGDWRNSGPGPNQTTQQYHGNWGAVYARAGDGWKIRMLTTNLIENEGANR